MKKGIAMVLSLLLLLLAGCGDEASTLQITSDSLSAAISGVEGFGSTIIYTAETDPNELLGRPDNYIGKFDFSDTRCEQYSEEDLVGGTVEYFEDAGDCTDRYDYLQQMNDPSLGAFGTNEYMYKYNTVLLRVSYELTEEQAEAYRDAMSAFLGEEPEQSY